MARLASHVSAWVVSYTAIGGRAQASIVVPAETAQQVRVEAQSWLPPGSRIVSVKLAEGGASHVRASRAREAGRAKPPRPPRAAKPRGRSPARGAVRRGDGPEAAARQRIVVPAKAPRPPRAATPRAPSPDVRGERGELEIVPVSWGEVAMLPCEAALVRHLGGMPRDGALVLISGPKGAGKSTAAAELVHALGRDAAWLDAEQDARQLGALWPRVGASRAWVERHVRRAAPGTATWREALEFAAAAPVVVWDSIHEWAESEKERGELVKELRGQAHPPEGTGRIVVAIAHFSASGGRAFGASTTGHRADLEVEVHPRGIHVCKCRFGRPPPSGWLTRDGRAMPAAPSRAEREQSGELAEMEELLSAHNYRPADAARLLAGGMGPRELEQRLKETGGLSHTHGLVPARARITRRRASRA